MTGKLLVLDVQVLLLQLLEESCFFCNDRIKGRVLMTLSEKRKVRRPHGNEPLSECQYWPWSESEAS